LADDRPTEAADLLRQNAGGDRSSKIQDCLEALLRVLADEIGQILSRARDHERLTKESLAGAMLLTKEEAAGLMRISVSTLDRKVKLREIEVTYVDRRPRFSLTEIVRFEKVCTRRAFRSR
jgi:hypothetical protein